jgi:hypothetical protein
VTPPAPLAALAAAILLAATGAAADVLELRDGQRVEGKLQQATPAFVAIEAGGRIVTYPTDQVLAIRFGPASAGAAAGPVPDTASPAARGPAPGGPAPSSAAPRSPQAREALAALQGFREFLGGGVTYKEYATRLAEVRRKVERVPRGGLAPADSAVPLENALRYYTSARTAWERSLQSPNGQVDDASMSALWNEPCPALRSLASRERGAVLSAAWVCAGDALDEAARTVR